MLNLPPNKKIILFDGVCNLCDSAVQFVIKHDKKDVFRFVALQQIGGGIANSQKSWWVATFWNNIQNHSHGN
jgi:predicted DCC family thiol-disulfide oxidoreductase YuxK